MGEDQVFKLGKAAFHDNTTVHPLGLTLLLVLGLLLLMLPRRQAIVSIIACASFIAIGQRVVVFSLDFGFLRIMVLFGWMRILLRQDYRGFRWQPLDRWFLAWAISAFVIYSVCNGATGVIYKLGVSFDSIGMYFIIRMLIRNLSDVRALVETIAFVSIAVFVLFLIENRTSRNLFAIFGGVPEITMIRNGKLRCQGAYVHPIIAGCFWAAIVPLIVGGILTPGRGKAVMVIGLFTSMSIVVMSASSTPIAGLLGAICGFALFPIRGKMRIVRWMIVIGLTITHFSMNMPVWHLISRTDLIGGSTGWHRYNVINQFILRAHEWFMIGARDITHWGIFANDITNQYVLEGIRGGLLTLLLFLYLVSTAFGNVGRAWRKVSTKSPADQILVWLIGVSLWVHVVNFFGVSYFGQIDVLWYISLALTAIDPVSVTVDNRVRARFTPGQLQHPSGFAHLRA